MLVPAICHCSWYSDVITKLHSLEFSNPDCLSIGIYALLLASESTSLYNHLTSHARWLARKSWGLNFQKEISDARVPQVLGCSIWHTPGASGFQEGLSTHSLNISLFLRCPQFSPSEFSQPLLVSLERLGLCFHCLNIGLLIAIRHRLLWISIRSCIQVLSQSPAYTAVQITFWDAFDTENMPQKHQFYQF